MKIVKSKGDAFDFKLSSTETITVTPEGIKVADDVAHILDSRCGVIIEEAPESEVAEATEEVEAPAEVINPVEPEAETVEAPVEAPVEEIAEVPAE